MAQSVNETLKDKLEKVQGKKIAIMQEGFMQSKFYIEVVKIELKLDVLSITDENCYIRFNLNQVSNVEIDEHEIMLFLDNDTKIIIKY